MTTVWCVLISPHEGDCIYGRPGEPMERVTPVADETGWQGGATRPRACGERRVWTCGHIHSTRDGALACAAGWSRRCPKCEGCLDDAGKCEGSQVLGPCGYRLPAVISDIMWAQERADATEAMMKELRTLIAELTADPETPDEADALHAQFAVDARFDCAARLEKILDAGMMNGGP